MYACRGTYIVVQLVMVTLLVLQAIKQIRITCTLIFLPLQWRDWSETTVRLMEMTSSTMLILSLISASATMRLIQNGTPPHHRDDCNVYSKIIFNCSSKFLYQYVFFLMQNSLSLHLGVNRSPPLLWKFAPHPNFFSGHFCPFRL